MREAEIIRLLDLPEEKLLEEVGTNLAGTLTLGATSTAKENAETARRWLDGNRLKICQALGNSERVKSFFENGRASDRVELVAACVDALSIVFTVTPIALIAVIIVRRGVREVCNDMFFG